MVYRTIRKSGPRKFCCPRIILSKSSSNKPILEGHISYNFLQNYLKKIFKKIFRQSIFYWMIIFLQQITSKVIYWRKNKKNRSNKKQTFCCKKTKFLCKKCKKFGVKNLKILVKKIGKKAKIDWCKNIVVKILV